MGHTRAQTLYDHCTKYPTWRLLKHDLPHQYRMEKKEQEFLTKNKQKTSTLWYCRIRTCWLCLPADQGLYVQRTNVPSCRLCCCFSLGCFCFIELGKNFNIQAGVFLQENHLKRRCKPHVIKKWFYKMSQWKHEWAQFVNINESLGCAISKTFVYGGGCICVGSLCIRIPIKYL